MNTTPETERRRSKRFLCNENFVNCRIHHDGSLIDVAPINFNAQGMAIFCNTHLAELSIVSISFAYQLDDNMLELAELACNIVYSKDSEYGDQFGLSFDESKLSEAQMTMLSAVAKHIEAHDDPEDRYGLNK